MPGTKHNGGRALHDDLCRFHGALNMNDRLEPFTDEQALAWLLACPQGRIETTVSDLARHWGWNRTKVFRRLRRWAVDGYIVRALEPSGRSVITATSRSDHAANSVNNIVAVPESSKSPTSAATTTVHLAEQSERQLLGAAQTRRAVLRGTASAGFAAVASAIAWFGIKINAWYGETLGETAEARSLIVGLSVSADVLALLLPAAARALWVDGHRASSGVAWALWTTTLVITLMATIGFAALNIADTTAARGKIAVESQNLRARLDRMRAERATIAETRSAASIEAELQRAQPSAAAVWRATAGCRDVTLPESGQACANVLTLRQALGTAQRRDTLDADLRDAETQFARLPAILTADPQAETAAQLINWATFGLIKFAADDIRMARVAGMALMPQIAGLVLMLATALWQSSRPPAPPRISGRRSRRSAWTR